MELEDLVDAQYSFNKARVADNLNLDYMDHCAVLAKRRGQANDLNRLAHDLASTNRKRPEAWIAVALYAETRGETEKALGFVEKAIALDSRHVLAFQLRGELLLGMGKAEHAIVAYFQANNYAKDLASYKGLVAAYLSTRKYKEALCTAKEAVATLPTTPRPSRSWASGEATGPGLFSGGKARGSGEPEFRAVKVCRKRPAWRQGTDETFAQLRREITALRLLDHPNVLRSYEDFEDATHYLFVMEYAAGGELFERLSKVGSFSERTAANLTRDVASALAHCHANGVIHRDMKLENLLLPTPLLRNVKLADFGMAHSDRGITTTLCGTPGFIAPEQRTGRPYGAKVDVWGLGCVLYIMLSGMEPFDAAEDEQAFERSDAGRGAAGPAPLSLAFPERALRDRSSRSKDLLAKCLTVDPDERIDAATILDHPFVRDGGRKNSYIGPSTTDKIGSLVKQRRLSGGRAPPSLSAVVSADDDAPSSSAGSSPDDVHLAAATAASMSAETPDLGLRALDDGAAAGGDDSPERSPELKTSRGPSTTRGGGAAAASACPSPRTTTSRPTATRASTATRAPPEPPSSPVSGASGLDASLHGLEPPDASAVDAMGRDVVELDLASIDLASNGAIRRFLPRQAA
ncbi:serine/threonine kinase [Aureococcus anophagefferens]|nr:serine/threonine kinase [Aureococcus anophagefferens]